MRRGIWIVSAATAGGAFVVLWQGRSYPWQLALLMGLAIGAFAYATQRTAHNVWRLSTREPPSTSWSDATASTPPPPATKDASSRAAAHPPAGGSSR